jgi:hypothetical protein
MHKCARNRPPTCLIFSVSWKSFRRFNLKSAIEPRIDTNERESEGVAQKLGFTPTVKANKTIFHLCFLVFIRGFCFLTTDSGSRLSMFPVLNSQCRFTESGGTPGFDRPEACSTHPLHCCTSARNIFIISSAAPEVICRMRLRSVESPSS